MTKIRAITIERQYCSGGSDIGKLVAKNLGIKCYDHELVDMAAKRFDITAEEIAKFEEAVINPLTAPISLRQGMSRKLDLAEKIFAAQALLIKEIATNEPCVIVGRCADYMLKNVVPTLSVYIYANQQFRISNATEVHKIPFEEVESTLKKYDKKRAEFYNINTTKNWSSMQTYDLCLNSSKLGLQSCADIISRIVENS